MSKKERHYCSYSMDLTRVDLGLMREQGWKCPEQEKPSPNSYQHVLLVTEKHGGDLEIALGGWYPIANYTKGFFGCGKDGGFKPKVYLYRTLNFLPVWGHK